MKRAMMFTCLLAAASVARAEHGLIKDNDKNGDGKLSWAEVEPIGWSRELFDLKDMDGDGALSEQDLLKHVAWAKTPIFNAKILKAMDTNGDGVIQKEGDAWWWGDEEFAQYDSNKDNVLDAAELARIPKAKPQRAAKSNGKAKAPAKPKS